MCEEQLLGAFGLKKGLEDVPRKGSGGLGRGSEAGGSKAHLRKRKKRVSEMLRAGTGNIIS